MPYTLFAAYGGAVGEEVFSAAEPLAGSQYVGCLGPFLPLDDLELDGVTFCEAFISVRCNCTVVNKNVRSTVVPNKPKTLGIVKPFNSPF